MFQNTFLPYNLLDKDLSLSLPFANHFFSQYFVCIFLNVREFEAVAFDTVFTFQQQGDYECQDSETSEDQHRDRLVVGRFTVDLSGNTILIQNDTDYIRNSHQSPVLYPEYQRIGCSQFVFRDDLWNGRPHGGRNQ